MLLVLETIVSGLTLAWGINCEIESFRAFHLPRNQTIETDALRVKEIELCENDR